MKKTTGKVVSLVLALALVVTSFSSTFAFASAKSETGTASIDNDTVYLSNGGSGATTSFNLNDYLGTAATDYTLKTYDHQAVTDVAIDQVTSSSSLLKVTQDSTSKEFTVTIKSASTTKGTFTLNVLLKGTYDRPEYDDPATVTGRATITVTVLAKDSVLIGTATTPAVGDYPDSISNVAKFNATAATQTVNASVYTVGVNGTTNALATYAPKSIIDSRVVASTTPDYVVVAYPALSLLNSTATAAPSLAYTVPNTAISAGNSLRLTAYKYSATATGKLGDKEVTANFSADNTVKGAITEIAKGDGSTVAGGVILNNLTATKLATSKTYGKIGSTYVDVTGANVVVDATVTSVTVSTGKIANLTVAGGAVIVEDGTVGNIVSGDDGVTAGDVTINGGSVGTITSYEGAASAAGTVVITAGTVASVAKATTVSGISGAKVGAVTASGEVTVKPEDDESAVTVGAISAAGVTVDSSNAKAVTGNITVTGDGTVALKGNATTVGSINDDYYVTIFDLSGLVGSFTAPTKAANATISADDEDTNAVVNGSIAIGTLSLDDGSVRFDSAVKVADLNGGTGTLVINAGALTVTDDISTSNTLKLADPTTVVAGTKVFTATSDIADIDSFNNFGFTTKLVAGTSTDSFVIDTVSFAGLSINKTASSIVLNDSETFTASPFPASQKLPAGYSVVWEFDGDDSYFSTAVNGNAITVKALNFDSTFASLNKGTLTAYVVDEYGVQDDSYAAATCNVTIIAKPAYTSDTNNNFSVPAGASYQFKITSTTAPVFTLGTSGVFTAALASHTGNDYFYKITATGKVGAATGIYINGNLLLVATVKAPAFTSDTKGNVTVKGAYTVKINAAAIPSFVIGSSNVFKATFVSKTGNDYFYKISSVGAVGTKAGIYVNGVLAFVGIVG